MGGKGGTQTRATNWTSPFSRGPLQYHSMIWDVYSSSHLGRNVHATARNATGWPPTGVVSLFFDARFTTPLDLCSVVGSTTHTRLAGYTSINGITLYT